MSNGSSGETVAELADKLANGISRHPAEIKGSKQNGQQASSEAQPAPVPAEKPDLKKSFLARVNQAKAQGATTTADLGRKLQESRAVSRDPEILADFAKLIGQIDEVGIEYGSFDRPREQAKEEWFALALEEVAKRLGEIAEQDEDVAGLLGVLNAFRENHFVSVLFWQAVNEFVRPFAEIATLRELQRRLNSMVPELVERNPERYNKDAVVLFIDRTKFIFAPKRQRAADNSWELLPILQIGWQFVQQAEKRAKEGLSQRHRELKAMRDKATLKAKEALDGTNGTFYVPGGTNRGLLMENTGGLVRIVEAIAFAVGQLPSRPMDWDGPWPSSLSDAWFVFQSWSAAAKKKAAVASSKGA